MLPLVVVEEIRRLLDEAAMSQRKIAAKLGVSRGTVGAISNGKRGMYGREPDSQEPHLCSLDLPPERCRGCGGKVYEPCVLCRARQFAKRQESLRLIAESGDHQQQRRVA
jgi:transcriptional regulator with XRE-family HTH domain